MLADTGFKANECNFGLQMKSKREEQRKKKHKNEQREIEKRSKKAREKEKKRKKNRERNRCIFVSIPTTRFSTIKHDSQISVSTVKRESR